MTDNQCAVLKKPVAPYNRNEDAHVRRVASRCRVASSVRDARMSATPALARVDRVAVVARAAREDVLDARRRARERGRRGHSRVAH